MSHTSKTLPNFPLDFSNQPTKVTESRLQGMEARLAELDTLHLFEIDRITQIIDTFRKGFSAVTNKVKV